jgi:hypothetical protein
MYPPENYDYKMKLQESKLNCISVEDFRKLKNTPQAQGNCEESKDAGKSKKDDNLPFHLLKPGTKIVHEVPHYPG